MRKKILFCIFHAFFLVVLTITLQYLHFSNAEESFFIKWVSLIKYDVFGYDKKPELANTIFLDVSKDLTFLSGTVYPSSKEVITDREKLAHLFGLIRRLKGKYKYVLCDIRLEDATPSDNALSKQLAGLGNVIFPSRYAEGKLVSPILPVESGNILYNVVEEKFTKLQLVFDDSVKSLPVKMYEDISRNKFYKKSGLAFFNNRFTFNTVIPELYIRSKDLLKSNSQSAERNMLYLGMLLDDSVNYKTYLENKFIVIGNFEGDIHKTYLEEMPGTLILFNCYLTLSEHKNYVQPGWMVMIFVFYVLISIQLISGGNMETESVEQKIQFSFFRKIFVKYMSHLGVLVIILLLSYILFNTWIHILSLAAYLALLQSLLNDYRTSRKQNKTFNFFSAIKNLIK